MEVDDQLLMALGWRITSKDGRIVEVEPPEDGTSCMPYRVCCASRLARGPWPPSHQHPAPPHINPHAAAAPADFPKSFPSVAEAVAHLRRLVGFVTPALAEKVIDAAVNEVLKAHPGVGWKARFARPQGRSVITDTYLRKAANMIVLRYVHRRT